MNQIDRSPTEHLPNLTSDQAIDLCINHWREGEGLQFGEVAKQHLNFANSFGIIDTIEAYFSNRKYEVDIDVDQLYELGDADSDLESFVKLVWLSKEYLRGGFREPLGVHYVPNQKANIIHSGRVRSQVQHLFHEGKVECLYFNTGGADFDWMIGMEPVDLQDYKGNADYDVKVIADHGSLIPQIHFNDLEEVDRIKETHKSIQEILNSDFRVYSNVALPALEPWSVKHPKDANHKIRLPAGYTTSDKLRAIIFAMLGKSYIGGY